MTDNPTTPADQAPLPAVIPGWPTAAAIYGFPRHTWFKAVKRGLLPTATINGRTFVQVAHIEEQIGRKLTWADIRKARPRKNASKAAQS